MKELKATETRYCPPYKRQLGDENDRDNSAKAMDMTHMSDGEYRSSDSEIYVMIVH